VFLKINTTLKTNTEPAKSIDESLPFR